MIGSGGAGGGELEEPSPAAEAMVEETDVGGYGLVVGLIFSTRQRVRVFG